MTMQKIGAKNNHHFLKRSPSRYCTKFLVYLFPVLIGMLL